MNYNDCVIGEKYELLFPEIDKDKNSCIGLLLAQDENRLFFLLEINDWEEIDSKAVSQIKNLSISNLLNGDAHYIHADISEDVVYYDIENNHMYTTIRYKVEIVKRIE